MDPTDLLFAKFRNLLIELLNEYGVPVEELDIEKITADLWNKKLAALDEIKELLTPKKYTVFHEKFINHPQIKAIWETNSISKNQQSDDDLFNQFKNELKSLWTQYQFPNDLDFTSTAERLFNEETVTAEFETIRENLLPKNFKGFKNDFERNEQLQKVRNAKKQFSVDDLNAKFGDEIRSLFDLEGISPNDIEFESLVILLLNNQDDVSDILNKHLHDVVAPKKIKSLIKSIQSSEKLKTLWTSRSAAATHPVEAFNSIVKSILKKHHFLGSDMDMIVSELFSNYTHGLQLIEEECTPEEFDNIQSDLISNKEIQSRMNTSTILQAQSAREMTNKELLEAELDKIWKDNAFSNLGNTLRDQFVACLIESGIESAMQMIMPKMVKKHQPILKAAISNNEKIQNIIGKPKVDDEKFEKVKLLQKIMLGGANDYSDDLFSKIVPLDFEKFQDVIRHEIDNGNGAPLIDVMMPYIMNKLKKGIDLSGLCASEIFWDDTLPIYGTDYKTILVCMIERYKNHQIYLVSLLKKLGIALPFAYQWIVDDKMKLKLPLRAYSHCLAVDCPVIISLGPASIGKSTLLNSIFNTQFITSKAGRINSGIDVIFSAPEFSCGFTIFDIHDHAYQQQKLVKVFCSILPIKQCWIILQSTSVDETSTIFKMLRSLNVDVHQIICIMRDCKRLTSEQQDKLRQNGIQHVLSICKIEHGNPEFNSNLVALRENLFAFTGIGEKYAKLPNNASLRDEDCNIYIEIEQKVCQQEYDDIAFNVQSAETRDFSLRIDQLLRDTDKNMTNLQSFFFQHIEANNKIQNERRQKDSLIGTDNEQKATKLSKIDEKIIELSRRKAGLLPSNLVLEYNRLFTKQKFNLITEMDRRVSVWQNPILLPLFKERNNILNELKNCQATILELKTKSNESEELKTAERNMKQLEQRKKANSDTIDQKTINKDFFMRELLAIYGDDDFLNQHSSTDASFDKNQYILAFIEYIKKGNEIEIIDGDNNEFNTKVVADIFRGLEVTNNDEAPYVISVIGPQSTGKSTLLNMLFGSNFQMSAGRCTKGLYASLFKTDYPNAKTLMVLDTEGLMSIEKANEEYDKKLTVFSMACSQIMLINLNGEINAAMKKILTISLFAANQLKIFRTRPIIIFILRNMMDLNVDKQKEMVDSVKKELKEVSELSQLELTKVLDFKEEKAFFLMLTAFNKDSVYNRNKELFQKSTTNAKFAELIQDLRKIIFDEALLLGKTGKKFKSLSDWVKQAKEIWATLNLFNNILMIESVKEINERKELGEIITGIMKNFIEPNPTKTSFRSVLEKILEEQEAQGNTSAIANSNPEERFDNEENIFREKVKSKFEEETKQRSFAAKLITEYGERLFYAIRSSKAQAHEKYKAIMQKRKVEGKIEASLMDLQIRSEAKILQWQKVKGDISDEEVIQKKEELKDWFATEMDKTKKQIKNDLQSNKKTTEQWRIFVKNQINSATGTIPVEKVFYSLQTLKQKAAELTSSSENIITLINGCREQSEKIHNIIKKVPTLMNNRKKKARYDRQNSCNTAAIQSRVKHEKLHIRKSENKLVAKWKQLTSWISDTFTFSPAVSATNEQKNQNCLLVQPCSEELSDLYDVCIDSEALVLIWSMFLEIEEYLTKEIKKEVCERAEYEIICLKQHLLQIHAKISELSQKFLDDDELEFTIKFGTELIEWLYDVILEKMITDEKNTYTKLEQKANERIEKLLHEFRDRVDKTFGDMENAELMAKKLLENLNSGCTAKIEREYKQMLKEKTVLHSSDLVRRSDEVFYGKNGIYSTDGIYEYITSMIGYMKKVYTKYFEDQNTAVYNQCDQTYRTLLRGQRQSLISNLKQLESIFKDFKTTDGQGTCSTDGIETFFKAYLEGTSTWEQLKNINEKHSTQLQWVQPKALDNPDALFKNIAFFPMTNPKVFIGALVNTTENLCEKELNDSKSKFNLTDDMLKEKDVIKSNNQQEALGCVEQCPFCGCKCEEGTLRHDAHQSKKHRLMAFNGSFEILADKKKGYIFDLCNSEFNIRHSKWRENSSSQLSVHDSKEIKERMSQYSVGQGDVTITLSWHDSNDLDLHVKCPCGTELYFGNTRCPSCSGHLDMDKNRCYHQGTCPENRCSSTEPIENVYFKPAKTGIYTVSVVYFSGPKGTAGSKSNFQVRVATHSNQSVQLFHGYVESSGSNKYVEVGQYEHSQGLNFLEHVKKNFPSWRNINIVDDKNWENVLKKAWSQVASRMSRFHGYHNNTPPEFASLSV